MSLRCCLFLSLLALTGCHTVVAVHVEKDWITDGGTAADLRTKAEVRWEDQR